MSKKPPLDQLLTDIHHVLQMIATAKPNGKKLDPVTLYELEIAETFIKTIADFQKEAVQEKNIDVNQLTQEVLESPTAEPKDKQFIRNIKEIEKEAQIIYSAICQSLNKKKGKKLYSCK
jgi:hypothetical protein